MLETLAFGAVESERSADGSHVIRMQQPYSSYAKALLEKQAYPDLRMYPGGPPKRPYDVTAHTLPLLFGVDVKAVDAPVAGPLIREDFSSVPKTPSLSASDTDTWVAVNAMWRKGAAVWRDEATGDFADPTRGASWKPLVRPRIGLYQSFMPNMDEGWTPWMLEQFGFAYARAKNAVSPREICGNALTCSCFRINPRQRSRRGTRRAQCRTSSAAVWERWARQHLGSLRGPEER